jgi:hypothetical protein
MRTRKLESASSRHRDEVEERFMVDRSSSIREKADAVVSEAAGDNSDAARRRIARRCSSVTGPLTVPQRQRTKWLLLCRSASH